MFGLWVFGLLGLVFELFWFGYWWLDGWVGWWLSALVVGQVTLVVSWWVVGLGLFTGSTVLDVVCAVVVMRLWLVLLG